MMRGAGASRVVRRPRRASKRKRKASITRESTADVNSQLDLRTRERDEALEQQAATSEVLKVISQSTFDLQTVLATLVRSAGKLCQAENVQIFLYDGEFYRLAADNGFSPEYQQYARDHPIKPDRNTLVARTALEGKTVYIPDALADPEYTYGGRNLGGYRTMLGVPLLRDQDCIGVIALTRSTVDPFTNSQVALVTNFAAQAVIAILNTRLLKELRQRTEEVAELNRDLEARVAAQVEELGRVGRLKRFLAPQLAELIVSQGDEKILESHRREIVVVFCDLRGYTAFTETAEPEEVLDFLRKYHGALGPLVSQFEGTLDQFSGDGIMVFFNDPVPIPDPAERAVKMAVAMREASSTLIAAWRERGRELGFGAGIAQGYATLGQIGFSERSGYTAIGTVCNVAARLCGEAKDGQILLSQRVNVTLKGSVATEQVGALDLKGLTHPVVAYNVPLTAGQPALRVIDGGNH
jgi:class 3 adenylate cyclase